MADFNVRSDNVDVEQIMEQIRARIREKRGVDYTEEEVRELARVKLERFLDPAGLRSDLLTEFRRVKAPVTSPQNFAFEDDTLFESHRAPIRWIRKLLKPILKLFFNPNPLIQALHIQAELNTRNATIHEQRDPLYFELMHNLVLETTRMSIEVRNLKMRLESIASRLDFDERRARALEGVVQYRPGAVAPLQPSPDADRPLSEAEQAERRTRRRRRRGRRRPDARDGSPDAQAQTTGEPAEDVREPMSAAPDAVPPKPEAKADDAPPKPDDES